MDLAQVEKLAFKKFKTKFLMLSVDVFSRFARVQPMRKKNAEITTAASIGMCSDRGNNRIFPEKKLWVDRGRELSGNFCEDVGIHIYHTFS